DSARFEEALLTGEAHPVAKRAGQPVLAGTACREHPARLRVTRVGSDTRLAQLAQLVERAQAHRPALARGTQRIASWFVTGVLLAAAAVYAFWRVHDPDRAFEVTLALLVVSCPCALSLAVPATLAAAHGALAKLGVLAVRPDGLDALARATDVVFDKTGTLGDGQPQLHSVDACRGIQAGDALRIAAALERDSGHPLATAFAGTADAPPASALRNVPGQGIEGVVEGRRWRLGQAGFATGGADDGGIWLSDGAGSQARFEVAEGERADARAAVDALHAQGLSLHLSSGDGASAVQRFAERMDIDTVHA